jgi:outer membrane immunogenic protein
MYPRYVRLIFASLLMAGPGIAGEIQANNISQSSLNNTPAVLSWSGPYIGAIIGYGHNASTYNETNGPDGFLSLYFNQPHEHLATQDAVFGLKAGYDWQFADNFIGGITADYTLSNMSGTTCLLNCSSSLFSSKVSNKIDGLATVRARTGYLYNTNLYYVSGGAAFARSLGIFGDHILGGVIDFTAQKHIEGYALGAGAEYKLSNNISIGAEYLHIGFDRKVYQFSHSYPENTNYYFMSVDSKLNLIRASLNYRY